MRSSIEGQGKFWRIKIKTTTAADGEHDSYLEILHCEESYARKRYDELVAEYSERSRAWLEQRGSVCNRRELGQAAKKEATSGAPTAED